MATVIKAHCNKCGPDRRHNVLSQQKKEWHVEKYDVSGTDKYFLIQCNGCENIHLRHDAWNTEDLSFDGSPEVTTVYYPPSVSRRKPDWLGQLDAEQDAIESLLKEIYSALHNNSRRLATMGIRALIEYVMIEKVGDKGTFEMNIKAFIDEGFLASKQEKLFRNHLIESGHAAMHRGYVPKEDELETLLDITETIVKQLYVHPKHTEKIKIPARKKS